MQNVLKGALVGAAAAALALGPAVAPAPVSWQGLVAGGRRRRRKKGGAISCYVGFHASVCLYNTWAEGGGPALQAATPGGAFPPRPGRPPPPALQSSTIECHSRGS